MLLLRFAIIELCMKTDKYWKKGKRKKRESTKKKEKKKERKEHERKRLTYVLFVCLFRITISPRRSSGFLFRGKIPIKHPLSFT